MSIRLLLSSFLALGLAAQPAPRPPQGGPGPLGPRAQKARAAAEHLEFLAYHLKLTDAQRAQIKAIHERHQGAVKVKQGEARAARETLRKAAARLEAGGAELKPMHQAAADRQFEVMMERRALRREVRAVFTPEQRAEADRLQALGEERRQFRMERGRKAAEGRPGRGFAPGAGMEAPEGPFQD